ncbi:MAG: prepilin-type N-terminal cleavage/methylation domain-containing protein [Candidatus Wildermuthbacteria bacterium]|nr:prepilin-type N-terminal cleavage/methylation domain-containing protein [Candidatus Wildermuthbacteria bacterium]
MNHKGITIVEVLVAVAVLVLALGAVSSFIFLGYQTQNYTWQQSVAMSEAQEGIETMVREIRKAQSGDDGSYVIEKAEDFQFVFFSDIDSDGKAERVRYFIDGSDFKKGVIQPSGLPVEYNPANEEVAVLSQHVRNLPPIFRYFDGNNQELSAPARLNDTKLMRVRLVINVNPNRAPQDFALESDVQIRNVKTNL